MMPSLPTLLPALLMAMPSPAAANNQLFPTAVKRQQPDSNAKILAHHLAFPFVDLDKSDLPNILDNDTAHFQPPFARHVNEQGDGIWRRAAQALDLLAKRGACPAGMNGCGDSGSPNKCCQQGTYCTSVPDTDVGHIACCPNGSSCGGGVGQCPSDATSCAAELGGGCCIPGYVCQGAGCVPSAAATRTSESRGTITSTQTTIIAGNPSVVIIVVTQTAPPQITTKTTTQIVPGVTNVNSVTGNPPWRPTGSLETTPTPTDTPITQTGCPTGFYGCLATHGGGCCRTDRDCQTYSCPAPSLTTIVSNGITIVVPAQSASEPNQSAMCANGWFLCGTDAESAPGCCPSGYKCGSASCFASSVTETGTVQKQPPNQSLSRRGIDNAASIASCIAVIALSILVSL